LAIVHNEDREEEERWDNEREAMQEKLKNTEAALAVAEGEAVVERTARLLTERRLKEVLKALR